MHQTLIVGGVVCIIAAIVGGGLKAFGVQLPLLNSVFRQVILGMVGIVFLFFGLGFDKKFDDSQGNGKEEKIDSSSVLVTTVQEMRIATSSDPQLVRPEEKTQINIFIYISDNTPVEGVRIKLRAPTGQFKNSGASIEIGVTDSKGRFITTWQAPRYYNPHRYRFDVSAQKEGFSDTSAHFSVGMTRQ